ncbi:MAG: hypothetical protein U0354_18415 [Candidatus Sericytochromatia bacterium]
MSFSAKEIIKSINPQIKLFIKNILGENLNQTNKSQIKSNNKMDTFSKKKIEDTITTPVSKKIWVNGKEYNVMALSQQELDDKIKTINDKAKNNHKEINLIDTNEFYFTSSNIKKHQEISKIKLLYQNYNIA